MERQLINYLPYTVRAFKEYQGITAGEQPEFELAWNHYQEVLDNQFIDTAGNYGVSRWERELGIFPKDTDSLTVRKVRIKAMWGIRPPYTLPWLKKWLSDLFGADGHWESVTDYTLDINLDCVALRKTNISASEIMELLMEVLPQNLWWRMIVSLEMQGSLHVGGGVGAQAQVGVPQGVDVYDFRSALHAGGAGGIHGETAVPAGKDDYRFSSRLHAGGRGGILADTGLAENREPPPATTILRTGGVCTILSNFSKGE